MSRFKTFDSTGVATGGRLYAGDLNAIQDRYADLSDFTQVHDVASLRVGASDVALSRFGTSEAQFSGHLRSVGILRGLGGIVSGAFTTTQRDAIAAGSRPFGMIILNTTLNRYQFNSGSDAVPAWVSLALDTDVTPISPIGAIADYGGSTDPNANWLLCDGRSLLRAGTYAALFTVIGTAFGSVDGTHFTIPDLRGRVTVGVDGAAARLSGPDTLGASSGEENHLLSTAEIPAHSHTMNHDHALQMSNGGAIAFTVFALGGSGSVFDAGGGGAGGPIKAFNGSTSSIGSGATHNNMQPYQVTNKIIRAI